MNNRLMSLAAAILALVLVFGLAAPALGQGDAQLTETFMTADGTFSVGYPAGWQAEESEGMVLLASTDNAFQAAGSDVALVPGSTLVMILPPGAVAGFGFPSGTEPAEIVDTFIAMTGATGSAAPYTGVAVPAAAALTSGGEFNRPTQVIALQFDGGVAMAIVQSGDGLDGLEPLIAAVLGSMTLSPAADGPAGGAGDPAGNAAAVQVECPNGRVIENGVELIVSARAGFSYTATALGIGGFDPIMAVRDAAGSIVCQDDVAEASSYSASLPTTGTINTSGWNAQIPFAYTGSDEAGNISIIVGGFGNRAGEFLLIIEGMEVASDEGSGAGDLFTLRLTPNVLASGTPVTAYMISMTTGVDALIRVVDEDNTQITLSGEQIYCDDAGQSSLCWGESQSLQGASVALAEGQQIPGWQYDSMLSIPLDVLETASSEDRYLRYLMTSFSESSAGQYVAAFHLGTSEGGETPSEPTAQPSAAAGDIRQWAISASGTSQYGTNGWSFQQAAGAPDTDRCGDFVTAWASATSRGQDSLQLQYAQPVIPAQVNIYETYNPGSIIHIELTNSETGQAIRIPNSADAPGNTSCPGMFTLDITGIDTPVDGVTIYLDQTIGGSWNEIDAVELVGSPIP